MMNRIREMKLRREERERLKVVYSELRKMNEQALALLHQPLSDAQIAAAVNPEGLNPITPYIIGLWRGKRHTELLIWVKEGDYYILESSAVEEVFERRGDPYARGI